MSDTKKLEREDAKVTGANSTGMLGSPFTATTSAIDRIEDLEHNLTVANTKMDAIIEGTDASLKQLTQMYADAMEQQGEFNKEMNRRNQNTNKRLSKYTKEFNQSIVLIEHRLNANIENVAAVSTRTGENMRQMTVLNHRMNDVYGALGVMFGTIVLILVVVGYLMFAGA